MLKHLLEEHRASLSVSSASPAGPGSELHRSETHEQSLPDDVPQEHWNQEANTLGVGASTECQSGHDGESTQATEKGWLTGNPYSRPSQSEYEADAAYYKAVKEGRTEDALRNRIERHFRKRGCSHALSIHGSSKTALSYQVLEIVEVLTTIDYHEEIPLERLCDELNRCLEQVETERQVTREEESQLV